MISDINEAMATLVSLKWEADQLITNHEGEKVWLKALYDEKGERIGIIDCCPFENPCDKHRLSTQTKD